MDGRSLFREVIISPEQYRLPIEKSLSSFSIDFDHINDYLSTMPRVAQRDIDDRRRAMTLLLREESYLAVTELCRRFKISEATARRDLVALSKQNTVVRTFGGAMADYDRRFTPSPTD